MRRAFLFGAMLLSCGLASANDFSFAQSKLKLSLPAEFGMVPRNEVEQLYAPGRGPGFVLGNSTRTVTVSNDLKDSDISGLNLSQALPVFAKTFEERVPALNWKDRKVVEIAKQAWLQLEFVSKSNGVDYYNIMLITPIGNKMLVLNFNATQAEFAAAQPVLREAVKSIALQVEAPEIIKSGVVQGKKKSPATKP